MVRPAIGRGSLKQRGEVGHRLRQRRVAIRFTGHRPSIIDFVDESVEFGPEFPERLGVGWIVVETPRLGRIDRPVEEFPLVEIPFVVDEFVPIGDHSPVGTHPMGLGKLVVVIVETRAPGVRGMFCQEGLKGTALHVGRCFKTGECEERGGKIDQ